MAYPCVLVLALTGAASVLLLYVVPKIRPMLAGQTLPVATQIVFGLTDLLKEHYAPILGLTVVVLVALIAFFQSARGQQVRARLQLRAWMIGRIYTMVALCRFCRILGTLLANGIPIIQSLEVAKDSAGNPILAEAIHNAAESVRQGEALTAPLAASKLFPPAILDMIAVAEESNTLDKTLVHIANTQEARTARQLDLFVRLLEPLLLMLTAGMVLFVAVALLLPILTMATSGVK
jgi:general secretion pathway protein F/type IV pilus assembly protein PilC